MNLAIVQTEPVFGEVKGNVASALALMETVNADLYVLPELFSTGYSFLDQKELGGLAEPATGFTVSTMAGFARGRKSYVVFGFAEKADGLYNACALVGPSGLIGTYRKIHLFYRERLVFAPGNVHYPVYDLPFGRIGLMICFDWIYPEAARTLALRGAQLIAHPSNLVLPHCPDAMITRCLEDRVFVAMADRVGGEKRGETDLRFIGSSEIVSPKGEVLVRMGGDPGIAVREVDLGLADDKHATPYNDLFDDRRPGMYAL